ncbi:MULTISPECIES: hypothetical protein [unclassified Pedobacter]|uniref:hypothetical protein n=1 Tax=unclassified Pedobacter TaxID=2628915 RepID=UPI001E2CA6EF|nr:MULTISPECIES: hypothetical protein [unclassified Pedobacter]
MIEVNHNTPSHELDNIKEGDRICYKHGKLGLVEKIQVILSKGRRKYFYKLKNDKILFLIR